jgi:hypothetical protein
MQKSFLSIVLLMLFGFSKAQDGSTLEGKVLDSKALKALPSAVVTVQNTTLLQLTTSEGAFFFPNVPVGKHYVSIKAEGYESQLLEIEVKAKEGYNMGEVILKFDLTDEVAINLVTLSENDLSSDDSSGGDNTAGLLQASRDAYMQAASFSWNLGWFRIRGLDNELSQTMVNGITMNKINTGRPQWANWGGLNDATRNQEFTLGSGPSDNVFGSILGTQNINTRASFYRKGSRANLAMTNTNYTYRAMFTHASGLNAKGWAYAISGSRRWAQEGNFPGTDFDGNSFLISVEKKINDQHSLNITSILAENTRGRNSFNTEEANDIMGVDYNSFWGWQDGKKRNARTRSINEPFTTLSHYWKINSKTKLNTNVAYQFGRFADSRIDFQNALNPDPTQWSKMPSYYLNYKNYNVDTGTNSPDFPNYFLAVDRFRNNAQVDWTGMYALNTASMDRQSRYVLYEDVNQDRQWSANSILSSQLADNILLNASVNYQNLTSNNFRELTDLLGGNYFLDFDPFLQGSAQTPDLNNPNRTIGVGEKYRYNFIMNANVIDAFTQFKFTYSKIDFYLAQNFSRSQYQREGLFKNGAYEDNSLGKSEVAEFNNYGFKGGLTYKITGRHLINFNAAHMSRAPVMRNVFANARMNNVITPRITNEEISSVDLSYIIRAPKLKTRLTAYYNEVNNASNVAFYFQEASNATGFVSELMTGIQRVNFGLEVGLDYQLTQTISIRGAAHLARNFFGNNPHLALNFDNEVEETITETTIQGYQEIGTSYLKNFRANSAPERAYSIGLEYRNPKFWWIGADMNIMTHRFLNASPILRTESFWIDPQTGINQIGLVSAEQRDQILDQERLEDMYILNIRGGKSWRTSKKNRNTIGLFASLNNALGTRYRTGGFEQARKADFTQIRPDFQTISGPNDQTYNIRTFGPRYFYSFGRNFFINLTYNF